MSPRRSDDRRYGGGEIAYERHGDWLGIHAHQQAGVQLRRDMIASIGLFNNAQRQRLNNDWRGAFAGLRVRYFGGRPLIEDDTVRSGSSTLVNLRAGYRFLPQLSVAVEVFNLFDRQVSDIEYFYESQLPGEGAPVEDIHFHPAEPQTFRVVLDARF